MLHSPAGDINIIHIRGVVNDALGGAEAQADNADAKGDQRYEGGKSVSAKHALFPSIEVREIRAFRFLRSIFP